MRVEGASDECDDFVTGLVQEALIDAEDHPDGFAPFAAVLYVDGTDRRNDYQAGNDPDAGMRLARSELSQVDDWARCVAVVWNGYADTLDGDREAVYAEVYELGRPEGHVVAMGYRRDQWGVLPTGQIATVKELSEPVVPLTGELMRRHLDEWAADSREDLRLFVEQLYADIHGFYDQREADMRAFDDDPRTCAPLLEDWLSEFPFGELDREGAVALLVPVARYIAEVFIRLHAARWDVTVDGGNFSHVIVVDGNDGRLHQIDPYAFVAEYGNAPLPPLSTILQRAWTWFTADGEVARTNDT
jgi:hypothetical protein